MSEGDHSLKGTDDQASTTGADAADVSSTPQNASEQGREERVAASGTLEHFAKPPSFTIPSSLGQFVTPAYEVISISEPMRNDYDWCSASSDSPMYLRRRSRMLHRGGGIRWISSPRHPFFDGTFVEKDGRVKVNPFPVTIETQRISQLTRRGRRRHSASKKTRLSRLRRQSDLFPLYIHSLTPSNVAKRRHSFPARCA